MTKKERDRLIDRLKNLIPEAEAFVDKQEAEGKSPYDKYVMMAKVLQTQIGFFVGDLEQGII